MQKINSQKLQYFSGSSPSLYCEDHSFDLVDRSSSDSKIDEISSFNSAHIPPIPLGYLRHIRNYEYNIGNEPISFETDNSEFIRIASLLQSLQGTSASELPLTDLASFFHQLPTIIEKSVYDELNVFVERHIPNKIESEVLPAYNNSIVCLKEICQTAEDKLAHISFAPLDSCTVNEEIRNVDKLLEEIQFSGTATLQTSESHLNYLVEQYHFIANKISVQRSKYRKSSDTYHFYEKSRSEISLLQKKISEIRTNFISEKIKFLSEDALMKKEVILCLEKQEFLKIQISFIEGIRTLLLYLTEQHEHRCAVATIESKLLSDMLEDHGSACIFFTPRPSWEIYLNRIQTCCLPIPFDACHDLLKSSLMSAHSDEKNDSRTQEFHANENSTKNDPGHEIDSDPHLKKDNTSDSIPSSNVPIIPSHETTSLVTKVTCSSNSTVLSMQNSFPSGVHFNHWMDILYRRILSSLAFTQSMESFSLTTEKVLWSNSMDVEKRLRWDQGMFSEMISPLSDISKLYDTDGIEYPLSLWDLNTLTRRCLLLWKEEWQRFHSKMDKKFDSVLSFDDQSTKFISNQPLENLWLTQHYQRVREVSKQHNMPEVASYKTTGNDFYTTLYQNFANNSEIINSIPVSHLTTEGDAFSADARNEIQISHRHCANILKFLYDITPNESENQSFCTCGVCVIQKMWNNPQQGNSERSLMSNSLALLISDGAFSFLVYKSVVKHTAPLSLWEDILGFFMELNYGFLKFVGFQNTQSNTCFTVIGSNTNSVALIDAQRILLRVAKKFFFCSFSIVTLRRTLSTCSVGDFVPLLTDLDELTSDTFSTIPIEPSMELSEKNPTLSSALIMKCSDREKDSNGIGCDTSVSHQVNSFFRFANSFDRLPSRFFPLLNALSRVFDNQQRHLLLIVGEIAVITSIPSDRPGGNMVMDGELFQNAIRATCISAEDQLSAAACIAAIPIPILKGEKPKLGITFRPTHYTKQSIGGSHKSFFQLNFFALFHTLENMCRSSPQPTSEGIVFMNYLLDNRLSSQVPYNENWILALQNRRPMRSILNLVTVCSVLLRINLRHFFITMPPEELLW